MEEAQSCFRVQEPCEQGGGLGSHCLSHSSLVLINRTVSVDVKHRDRRRNTRSVYLSEWTSWASHRVKSVRSCVEVEVAVLGSRPNKPYGFYGRKATLNCTGPSFSLTCQPTSEDMKLYVIITLHSPPLTVRTVSVEVTQHLKEEEKKKKKKKK